MLHPDPARCRRPGAPADEFRARRRSYGHDHRPSPATLAQAFSTHRFAETYDHLAHDIVWTHHGATPTIGRAAVVAACDDAATHLVGVRSELLQLRAVEGVGTVVVETLTRYAGPDGDVTVVASADFYDHADGVLTAISSYTVEVPDPAAAGE